MAEKKLSLGLGEAIRRLIKIEISRNKFPGKDAEEEQKLIEQALNQYTLDLGFDCNDDGVPDTIEIFKESANTSCCRILPHDTSRRSSVSSESRAKSKSRRSRSRKKE